MMSEILKSGDLALLEKTLQQNPQFANQGIELNANSPLLAHPLHRLCDYVWEGQLSQNKAIELATFLINQGSDINGFAPKPFQDTPLIAAASMYLSDLGEFYLSQGADTHIQGCYGGTALHWAAWCGLPSLVKKLIPLSVDLNQKCFEYEATPLFWSIHGLKQDKRSSRANHLACVKHIVESGANLHIPNKEGLSVFDLMATDTEVLTILK